MSLSSRLSPGPWYDLAARNGRFQFAVRQSAFPEDGEAAWDVFAIPDPEPANLTDFYFCKLVLFAPEIVRVDSIANHLPEEYRGCGLTEALYPALQRHFGGQLVSSPLAPQGHQSLNAATKHIWDRLVDARIARLDTSLDRYVIDPRSTKSP
jgi:hypothetical protein